MSDYSRAYLQLQFCVLLWGFTGILGKLITLQAVPLVFWRVLLCCVLLPFLFRWQKLRELPRPVLWKMFWVGALIAAHWCCFYGSIKLANASVAMVTMAFCSFFAALVEPFLLKKKVNWLEMGLGALVLPGMFLVAGSLDSSMWLGFVVGVICAFGAAVFSIFNKKIIEQHNPPALVMSFVELASATFWMGLILPALAFWSPETQIFPQKMDWVWLVVLAWVCTVLPFSLSLKTMRQVSAFTVNLSLNLEPVYGILLAALLLREHEQLNWGFYVGTAIILLAVFIHARLKKA